jgi:hypothetical protein
MCKSSSAKVSQKMLLKLTPDSNEAVGSAEDMLMGYKGSSTDDLFEQMQLYMKLHQSL